MRSELKLLLAALLASVMIVADAVEKDDSVRADPAKLGAAKKLMAEADQSYRDQNYGIAAGQYKAALDKADHCYYRKDVVDDSGQHLVLGDIAYRDRAFASACNVFREVLRGRLAMCELNLEESRASR